MNQEFVGLNRKICQDLDGLKDEVWTATVSILTCIDEINDELKDQSIKIKMNLETIQNFASSLKGYAGAIK